MEAYVYWCYNDDFSIVYGGCQYSKKCNHNNLGKTYFTSSKIIKPLFKSGKLKGEVIGVLTGGNYIWRKSTILQIEANIIQCLIDVFGRKAVYNQYCNGDFCNKSETSGTKGTHLSEARKKYLSEINKIACAGKNNPMYGHHHSEETKNKIAKCHIGKPTWNKGKQWTKEIIEKQVNSRKWFYDQGGPNKGKKMSEEQREKLSEITKKAYDEGTRTAPWKGKHLAEETKKKISESNKGHVAWNKGIPASEEAKKKMSETRKGKPSLNKGKKVKKLNWKTPQGDIIQMDRANAHKWHPDWVLVE